MLSFIEWEFLPWLIYFLLFLDGLINFYMRFLWKDLKNMMYLMKLKKIWYFYCLLFFLSFLFFSLIFFFPLSPLSSSSLSSYSLSLSLSLSLTLKNTHTTKKKKRNPVENMPNFNFFIKIIEFDWQQVRFSFSLFYFLLK